MPFDNAPKIETFKHESKIQSEKKLILKMMLHVKQNLPSYMFQKLYDIKMSEFQLQSF